MVAEYTICAHADINKLIKEVNSLIAAGWQPHGELVVTPSSKFIDGLLWSQTMIKEHNP